jgi:hypothetical protein
MTPRGLGKRLSASRFRRCITIDEPCKGCVLGNKEKAATGTLRLRTIPDNRHNRVPRGERRLLALCDIPTGADDVRLLEWTGSNGQAFKATLMTQPRHRRGTQTWPQSDRCFWLLMGFETMGLTSGQAREHHVRQDRKIDSALLHPGLVIVAAIHRHDKVES